METTNKKQEVKIVGSISIPSERYYNIEILDKVVAQLEKLLELTENYSTFIRIGDTKEQFYISVRGSRVDKFKSFGKGKTHNITEELKETILLYIEDQINRDKKRKESQRNSEHYGKLAFDAVSNMLDEKFNIYFGAKITIKTKYPLKHAECNILQNGTITEPMIDCYINSSTTIGNIEAILTLAKESRELIYNYATTIKNALPKEFFINI